MIEVFKTNIRSPKKAKLIIEQVQQCFNGYEANFDLNDRDKVLRVVSNGNIPSLLLIEWLKNWGCIAEILPDN